MLVPNRHGSSNSYRYGFNGMEKDDELKGDGNSYDFEARILDPRIGRWLSLDSYSKKSPFESNYAYVSNSPLIYKDPDGNDKYLTINMLDEKTGYRMVIKIKLSDELKSVKRWVSPSTFECGHYEYDWHDINVTQNVIRKSDGSFVMSGNSVESLTTKRTSTYINSETYANAKLDAISALSEGGEKAEKYEGGIAWYSKNGQSEEKRIGNKNNVQFEEGQELIDAMAVKGGPESKAKNFGEQGKKFNSAMHKFFESVKHYTEQAKQKEGAIDLWYKEVIKPVVVKPLGKIIINVVEEKNKKPYRVFSYYNQNNDGKFIRSDTVRTP